jgi:hypothetical protein
MFRLQPFDTNDLRSFSDESIMVPQPRDAIHNPLGLIEERETMAKLNKLEKLRLMSRKLRSERHEANLLRDEMPHIRQKVVWSEKVIYPLTTIIDDIEEILVRANKLKRKQGFVQGDQTFGGLL